MATLLHPVHGLVVELEPGEVMVVQPGDVMALSPRAESKALPCVRGCAHALCAIGGSEYCTLFGAPGEDAVDSEPGSEPGYECRASGAVDFNAHKRTHGGAPYASELTPQKRPHTGERPYVCDEPGCDYKASGAGHLSKHKRMHSSERPYVCNEPGCDYKAKQDGHLREHKRTHTGERPYVCDQPGCDYKSKQAGSLNSHRRTHTGERPYACDEPDCGYRATRACRLKKHKEKHRASGEQPYAHDDEPEPEAEADNDGEFCMTVRRSPLPLRN
jgi:hypothetical protein